MSAIMAVAFGIEVTPMPSSNHVRPINKASANQTLRKYVGTFLLSPGCGNARHHNFRRTTHAARVSHGQIAHHTEPRKKTETTTNGHHQFHTKTVARFLSGDTVPKKPEMTTKINAHTVNILRTNNGMGEAFRKTTKGPITGIVDRFLVFSSVPAGGSTPTAQPRIAVDNRIIGIIQAIGRPG